MKGDDLKTEEPSTLDFANCPIAYTMNIIGGKWKPVILNRIQRGINRFGVLQKSMPGISKQVLTAQLRELENAGLLSRKVYAEVPPRVEYGLTESGKSIFPVLEALEKWGLKQRKMKK